MTSSDPPPSDDPFSEQVHRLFRVLRRDVVAVSNGFASNVRRAIAKPRAEDARMSGLLVRTLVEALNLLSAVRPDLADEEDGA